MRKGDILLIKYRFDPVGWLIRRAIHSQWNHVGIAMDCHNIIEARGSGVIIRPLKRYKDKRFYKIKLLRVRQLKKEQFKIVLNHAVELQGKYGKYGKWVLTLLLIAFGFRGKLVGRTCSGLVAECFSKVDWYFRKDKDPLRISPADISKSKGLENVSNEL